MIGEIQPVVKIAHRFARRTKKIRATLHNCITNSVRKQAVAWARQEKGHRLGFGYSVNDFKLSLQAKIGFVLMVNPVVGKKLKKQFKAVDWTA